MGECKDYMLESGDGGSVGNKGEWQTVEVLEINRWRSWD